MSHPDYERFAATLIVDDELEGVATVTVAGGPTARVPICDAQIEEDRVTFSLEAAYPPALSCSEIRRPVMLRGRLGARVLIGTVLDAEARKIGRWRAYREKD